MMTHAEHTLLSLWDMYGTWAKESMKPLHSSNQYLLEEFFFIILGGYGISYEQNLSGLQVFKDKGLIQKELYSSEQVTEVTEKAIRRELNVRQFEPKTKAGEFRKYRFVQSKPRVITRAGHWLWCECNWDLYTGLNDKEPLEARNWLHECPGFGMKSASWFLRNTGFCDDFAVFDVHVLRFLERIGVSVPKRLNDKTYLQLEEILREICYKIGATLGALDYLLWCLGRNGFLSYVR
ncbi:MAG: hypothetical protein FH756_18550 [Firmicutes bacterium]|nr:hypothetical protein [Bacillota bacterium]